MFFIGTANDISKLPPEFTRAERLDAVFFLDLPADAGRKAIWEMYRREFGIAANQKQPADENWTGAEIRACCRLAALLDLSLEDAAKQIVPVAVTAAEAIEKLRMWASGRCPLVGSGRHLPEGLVRASAPSEVRSVAKLNNPTVTHQHPETASPITLFFGGERSWRRSLFGAVS